jgi:y4mF family transcriptional regulator
MQPELGKIVRFHRKEAGLTQKELADMAGVGKAVVYDLEKGKTTQQLDTILKILKVLNITLEINAPLKDKFEQHAQS